MRPSPTALALAAMVLSAGAHAEPRPSAKAAGVLHGAVEARAAPAPSAPEPVGLSKADRVIPPSGPAKALALIISGDGGWGELERSLGAALAQHGVAVIGLDSLRYFWSPKEPKQTAVDLARLIRGYGRAFDTRRYALVGFSFGADILPDVWPLLPGRLQERVSAVVLLSPSRYADFEVTVATLLGLPSGGSRHLLPALRNLPADRTQCFYGHDEARTSACTAGALSGATIAGMTGGHGLGGQAATIADLIVRRLAK